ncbi:MAG TPA: YceI family protein [Brumimicrobium sp.]|nr:YceI family protein [Brumimicrobium sp.]
MKKNIKFLALAFAGLLMTSCAGNVEVEEVVEETTPECMYSYDAETTEVGFVAYKFLNRTGVGGAFETISMTGVEAANSAIAVLENVSFEIEVESLNTKDAGRDEKVKTFFFKEIDTDVIAGKMVSIDEAGNATVEITMNGVTNNVEGTYTLNDTEFAFTAEIDVLDWEAGNGIEALNEECHELHIDLANDETESKLWSEVTVSFKTTLTKVCE